MATYSSVRLGRGRGHRRGETRRPGQWKLAYADFLTALMAFFLLMWLSTGSSQTERMAIAAYFTGADIVDARETAPAPGFDIQATLLENLSGSAIFEKLRDSVQLTESPRGLRVDLTDGGNTALFETASGDLNETGSRLVGEVGRAVSHLPVNVSIEGHTDAFVDPSNTMSNWVLSSERAHSALLALRAAGVENSRVTGVIGLASTKPLLPSQPHASINRRVSIVLELSHQ